MRTGVTFHEATDAPTEIVTFTATYDAASNRVEYDISDVTENNVTTDTDGFAIVFNTGTAATSPIFYSADIEQLRPTDGPLALTIDANGVTAENMAAS